MTAYISPGFLALRLVFTGLGYYHRVVVTGGDHVRLLCREVTQGGIDKHVVAARQLR